MTLAIEKYSALGKCLKKSINDTDLADPPGTSTNTKFFLTEV